MRRGHLARAGVDRAPGRAQELALVVQDVDGDGTIQWLVTGIPPDTLSVEAGTPPAGGEVRANSAGTATWASPCPQDDFQHRILFSLYVLDGALPEGPGDPASVISAIEDNASGSSTIVGRASPLLGDG